MYVFFLVTDRIFARTHWSRAMVDVSIDCGTSGRFAKYTDTATIILPPYKKATLISEAKTFHTPHNFSGQNLKQAVTQTISSVAEFQIINLNNKINDEKCSVGAFMTIFYSPRSNQRTLKLVEGSRSSRPSCHKT